MTLEQQRAEVEAMLTRVRELRDQHTWGEVRQAFNGAADRLDVLASKLWEEQKKQGAAA